MATSPATDRPRLRRRRRRRGVFTRSRSKLVVVSAATILCLYLCYRLAQPFLPALVWATTGAVITHSFIHWLARWIQTPKWRAAVGVAAVALLLFVPVIALTYFTALEIYGTLQSTQPADYLTMWQQSLARFGLDDAWSRVTANIDLQAALGQLGEQLRDWSLAILTGFVYMLIQAAIALFVLFFLYRDEDYVLKKIHRLSPFTDSETKRLRQRIGDTIHATIAGIVLVAIVQGTLGGVIFALLGMPAPILWGAAMMIMAMIPYLGTSIIWGPTAIFLALSGEWGKALILAAWGMVAIGLIDNLLYPMLVGNRLRQHTVVAFLAIVGGVTLFGATGIVLGPVFVTLTFFLLEVWRRRTEAGQPAECT